MRFNEQKEEKTHKLIKKIQTLRKLMNQMIYREIRK